MTGSRSLHDLSLAVLFGGTSGEREVSIASANAVISALREAGFEPREIDTGVASWWSELTGIDIVFNILHGRDGEDGTVRGCLEALNIVSTGSGVLGSALAMDKVRSKYLWQRLGLPTAPFAVLTSERDLQGTLEELGPVFVKPACEGSSLGMMRAENEVQLAEAYANAAKHNDVVLAEALIDGPEYTVGIVGDRPLPVIRIEAANTFYDYEAKYTTDTTLYHIPSGLSAAEEDEVKRLALRAFQSLGCSVWGRVDLMRNSQGEFQLLEVNTIPGMTDHSLVPKAAMAAELSMPALVEEILRLSLLASGREFN